MVRIWWGERLLDQRVCAAGTQLALDSNLRAEWLTAERPERVAADPWSQFKDFAVPLAMIAMLVGALVMAVVPTHESYWYDGGTSLALDDGSGGAAKVGRATTPVQVASGQRSQHGEARVAREREAILSSDTPPTQDAPPVAPKDAAKKLVDELFAGVGEIAKKSPQLDAALGSLAVGTTFASSGSGFELRGDSGGSFGPVKVAAVGIGGIGPLTTRGRGGGEAAYGSGVGLIAGRKSQIIVDIIAQPVVIGGLDKELISKVMKLHGSEIRYCYENALLGDPELEGRLAVRFVIAENGTVAIAEVTDSLGNSALDDCITSRLRRWHFPSTPGGGVVVVNYPWQFSHGH
ncbi:MAG: AgmX/PglI C-terminal domain-containing protein [Archangium sp.]